jgi:hypothetical protein
MQLLPFLLMSAYALAEQHWYKQSDNDRSYGVMVVQFDVQAVSVSECMNHFYSATSSNP